MAIPLIEKSLVEIKLGDYGVGAASAFKNPALLPMVQNYKRQIASRMYPLGKSDISRKVPDAEYLVSRKIDGEFTVLIFDRRRISLGESRRDGPTRTALANGSGPNVASPRNQAGPDRRRTLRHQ